MKELSIEEKAKRYDEAVINGSRLWECGEITRGNYEDIFPELKEESEDERIREAIINLVNTEFGNRFPFDGFTRKQMLAWLEKQGEQPQGKSALEAAKEEKVDNQNCVKPTDKVEPKFKIGDEIIKSSKNSYPVHSSTDDTICKVAEIHDTCYILDTKEGKIQEPFEWQDYYKLVEQKPTEDSCKNSDDITTEEKDRTEYKKGFECGKQRVLKYPEDFGLCKKIAWSEEDKRIIDGLISICDKAQEAKQAYFIEGYHQAEKDLELTWEDMLVIHRCIKDAMNKYLYAFQTVEGRHKVYEEVLKRFKAQKGE